MPPVPTVRPDGHKIRQIRQGLGLKVTPLAHELGRHPESLFKIECSSPMTSEKFMAQIAARLGVEVSDITAADDSDEEQPEPAEPQQHAPAA
jgi:transcriptional regulator with XRE-family HTH domain